jgi:hypothetical protein
MCLKMAQQLRSLFVEYANLNKADASALYCQGKSVMQAVLNGPEEIASNREDAEQAVVSVIYRKAIGGNKGNMF